MPWQLPSGEAALLALAKSYPYEAPSGSFLFADGVAEPIDGADFAGRTAVLAHGSNRSPAHLQRKYGRSETIPVTTGWLTGYDVVYSAHVTQYGSVASTLQYVRGCRVRVSITWLTAAQLRRMHETEGPSNYSHGRLTGLDLRLDDGPVPLLDSVQVYLSKHGCLSLDGAPAALAAVTAEARPHRALHQEEILTHVRDRHRPGDDLNAMILSAVRDPASRSALVAALRSEAVAQEAPDFEALPATA